MMVGKREYQFEFSYEVNELGDLEITAEARVVHALGYVHHADPDNPYEVEILSASANGHEIDPDAVQIFERRIQGKCEWHTLRSILEVYADENAEYYGEAA